ncbi:MAG: hypothetical protein MI920_22875 [Kiloniellales bacterium]|nr:hypothetical protein [Kiloniellales bacterium]
MPFRPTLLYGIATKRRGSLAVAGLLALALSVASAEVATASDEQASFELLRSHVDRMPANSWLELPDVHCRDQFPSQDILKEYRIAGRTWRGWGTWTTAAFDGRAFYFGPWGGNDAYGGNETYRLDLETLECEVFVPLRPLLPPAEDWPEGVTTEDFMLPPDHAQQAGYCAIRWATEDGTWQPGAHPAFPTGAHTYGGMIYSPKTNSIFWHSDRQQCAGRGQYRTSGYWELDLDQPPEKRAWTWFYNAMGRRAWKMSLLPDGNLLIFTDYFVLVVDPGEIVSRRVDESDSNSPVVRHHKILKRSANIGHSQYRFSNVAPTPHSDGLVWGVKHHYFTIDPKQRDGSKGLGPRLREKPHPKGKMPPWDQNYASAILSARDRLWLWNGGNQIDAYDPASRKSVRWTHADGPVAGATGKLPFQKIVWMEEPGVFVAHANPHRGLYLYKPAEDLTQGDDHWPPHGPGAFCVEGGACLHTFGEALAAVPEAGTVIVKKGNHRVCAQVNRAAITIVGEEGASLGGKVCRGKAALVVNAPGVTLRNLSIELNSTSYDCIRLQAPDLTLQGVRLRNCGNGVLSAKLPGSFTMIDSLVENVGGDCNAEACGQKHGVYLSLDRCVIKNSVFRHPKKKGHLVKSRCQTTVIEDSLIDSSQGSGSRLIDLPNGGVIEVRNNRLVSGGENIDVLAIGLECRGKNRRCHEGSSAVFEGNKAELREKDYYLVWRDVPDPQWDNGPVVRDWGLPSQEIIR